ncbi:uncharacterized protein PV09_07666 [Verruconis gallopava]|uniref:AB hydrolase-1 domain-containing protein n=1 Tax=Verruconis gallopava TaxID=253628 RepID=A0A0D2A2D8_9PEZI|nr:uncharacterized protein PV09_07666 [Verruconis gallopava]KIW00923.1 hypothetical protein PV09_07666 [Verruconis gallopava]
MRYATFTANDGCAIAYQTSHFVGPVNSGDGAVSEEQSYASSAKSGSLSTCILLLHGFSGSSDYFVRNTNELSQEHWVIAPDLRGHGQSQHTSHGYHVARLAMDLHELVTGVIKPRDQNIRIYATGCSIGAAVLWTYVELFTDADFAGLIFVDQAPLQDRCVFDSWGPELAHYGCYDEATTLEAQRAWASDDPQVREQTYVGLVMSCLGYRYAPMPSDKVTEEQKRADEDFFVAISRTCNGPWLARLLSDHTRYDHREAIEQISKPVLVMAGRRSGCFSVAGMEETVRRAKKHKGGNENAKMVVFDSGHWLFWEESERFNRELLAFVKSCETSISLE